jgi:hypothetical protein
MTPEGEVRKHLRKQTLAHGGEHRKLRWIGRANAPDEFIFWSVPEGHPPIAAFVECKRPKFAATAAQAREHERMRAAGFRVEVVDTKDLADMLISELTKRVQFAWMQAQKTEAK